MSKSRVTQTFVSLLATGTASFARVTSVGVKLLAKPTPGNARVTSVGVRILATRNVNYETISMVLPDIFPNDISYDSVGSTRFATDVIVVDSGDDQRVQRWQQPLMEYDVAYGVRTMEQLLKLIAFFRAMRGRFYAFCYVDNVDYTSSIPLADESRSAPPIQVTDQAIGIGDGLTYVFQLVKSYNSQTQTQTRIITRPKPGSVLIGLRPVSPPVTTQVANWSVDVTTGLVTFTPPYSDTIATSVAYDGAGNFSGAAHTFDGFAAYYGSNCTVSGMAHAVNNSPLSRTVSIGAVSSDGSTMYLGYGSGYGTTAETVASGLAIAVHPAPPYLTVVSAGYQFYVPVRFDTDILPVTIQDYGIGGSNSVKLIEVRGNNS